MPTLSSSLFALLVSLSVALSYNSARYYSGNYNYQTPLQQQQLFVEPQPLPSRQVPSNSRYKQFTSIYAAKNVEFGFPSEAERARALASGLYNPDSAIPIDVDVFYPPNRKTPRIFMTIPRFGLGVPYSLAYLTDVQKPNGTEVQPYPNYQWHSSHGKDCDGLQSVYRTWIDSCGQMWILDSGEINFVQWCAPQVVVIDLATDQLVHRYRLPETMYKTNISRFVMPLVDIADPAPRGFCKQAFVYMADPTGTGIVVYNVNAGRSWRIENKFTNPDPAFGIHTVAGESFELHDGAFSISVTPNGIGLRRMLYFHALSNDAQIAIPLDVVNDERNWQQGSSSSLDQFVLLGKRGVQCAAGAMNANGIHFCAHLNPIGIFGWNIRTPFAPQNRQLLAENPETLQFVSGMKVIKNRRGKEELWLVSNRLQKVFTGTINYNEINYRIQKCGVDELLAGRPCRN